MDQIKINAIAFHMWMRSLERKNDFPRLKNRAMANIHQLYDYWDIHAAQGDFLSYAKNYKQKGNELVSNSLPKAESIPEEGDDSSSGL